MTELEAAVERVTEPARLTEQITHLAAWTLDPATFPEPCVDDVQGLLHALAEANERCTALEGHLLERIAERDEARADLDIANDAMQSIRKACAEITGGNATFIDDDFARALLVIKGRAETAESALAASEARRERGEV